MIRVFLATVGICSFIYAGNLCDAKTRILEQKINAAEASNLIQTKENLQRALHNHKRHCDDNEIIYKQKKSIAELQEKLSETELKLQEAKFKGKSIEKINKIEQKRDRIKNEILLENSILELLTKEVNENNSK